VIRRRSIGLIPPGPDRRSPDTCASFIGREIEKWAGPVKTGGLQVD
jgi:hypothetical protein